MVVVLLNGEEDTVLFGDAQITQNAVLHITEKQINNIIMTKAEIVTEIAAKTGFEKQVVMQVVEGMMETIKASMINGDEVFLRDLVVLSSSIVQRKQLAIYPRIRQ